MRARLSAEEVSVSEALRKSATTAKTAPSKNGIRHPHARNSAVGKRLLDNEDNQRGEQLAADQRHVLERSVKASLARQCDFAHVGRAGSVLATDRKALNHSGEKQQNRCRGSDGRVGRHDRDGKRARAHHQHGNHHRVLAAKLVGDEAKDVTADRPHQKADGEHGSGLEKLGGLVALGKKRRREIQRRESIGIKVVPFDEIAGGATENCPNPAAAIGVIDGVQRDSGHATSPPRYVLF